MALSPNDAQELRDLLAELNNLYDKLGKKRLSIDFNKAVIDDLDVVNELLSDAKVAATDLEDGFGGIARAIKNIVKEWKPGFADPTKEATKSFKTLKGLAEKLSNDVTGITDLNRKQLEQTKSQIAAQQKILEGIKTELETKQRLAQSLTQEEQNLLNNLNAEYDITAELLRQTNKRIDQEKALDKQLGLTGTILKGISKIPILKNIPGLNDALENTKKKLKQIQQEGGELPSKWKVFKMAIGDVGKALKDKITDPMVVTGAIIGGLVKFIKSMWQGMLEADKQTTNLANSLGISKDKAYDLRDGMVSYAASTGDSLIITKDLLQAQSDLTEQLGMAVDFGGKTREEFAKLTTLMGLSASEAGKLELLTGKTGENVGEYASKVLEGAFAAGKANKIHMSSKQVLQEISKVSAKTLINFKGDGKAIGAAVVEAKKLGLELKDMEQVSSHLLNFEDSIGSEIEAELLTGKALNLEKARYAALTGDTVTLMREMRQQAGSLADFEKMNVIQRESLAKAFGVSIDQMSEMLMKQELNNKYGKDAEKLTTAQAKAFTEAQKANSKLTLGDFLKQQSEQADRQKKFENAIEKLKDLMVKLVDGPLKGMIDGLTKVLNVAGKIFDKIGQIKDFFKNIIPGGMHTALGNVAGLLTGGLLVTMVGKSLLKGTKLNPMVVTMQGGNIGSSGSGITDILSDAAGGTIGKGAFGRLFSKGGRGVLRRAGGVGNKSLLKGLFKGGAKGIGKSALKGLGKFNIASIAGGIALDYFSAQQMDKAAQLEQEAEKAKTEKDKKEKLLAAKRSKNIGKGLDIGSAALTGAGLGATLGSAFFGIGAVPGAAIGGALGAGYGLISNYGGQENQENQTIKADDFVIKTHPKDTIVAAGGTKLGGGDELLAAVKELIAVVKTGGNVYLDGAQVGKTLALATYKTQ